MYKEKYDFYSPINLKSYNLDQTMRYQLDMLERLDPITRKHSENVANLSCRICEYLRCSTRFTIHCTIAAFLHDIGKLFIPPEILNKPTKLTDEEYEIMKTHTTIGYKMCMQDNRLMPYAAGPLYHHEGLDGSGYPNGLTKKEIPLEGQIIRVADEYDAITSKRQYKTHIDISDTLQILANKTRPDDDPKAKIHSCGKMKPAIVKVLFKVVLEDIEYEITCIYEYIDYLKSQIKRLEDVEEIVQEMYTLKDERDKEEYLKSINEIFEKGENLDNYIDVKEQYEKAYIIRKEKIDKLYNEIKKIKKIKI